LAISKNYKILKYLGRKAPENMMKQALRVFDGKTRLSVIEMCLVQGSKNHQAMLKTASMLIQMSEYREVYTPR
jgi:hypothetical protein